MSITDAKAALRQALAALPQEDYTPLLARFMGLEEVKGAKTLLLFYGVGREPDTTPVIKALLAQGKRVCLPRCLPGGQMEAAAITGLDGLVPSSYHIPEPGVACPTVAREEIDVILAPNLCCDRAGYRLGRGGGYYDRYLAGYGGFTVALCPAAWLQESLPREDHDRPVDLVLF